jgi:hypothetical protein
MKVLVLSGAFALAMFGVAAAQGSHYVGGYYWSNGTYVAPHYQTNPDSSRLNNWSTQGNVNPYTGQMGTRSPYPAYNPPRAYAPPAYGYSQPSYGYTPGYPQAPCCQPSYNGFGSSYGSEEAPGF